MNAPAKILTIRVGEAIITVPEEIAGLAYVEKMLDEQRPFPAAIERASTRLDELRERRPDLGKKGLYGIYAGIARGYNGEPDGILEVIEEAPKAMTFDDAVQWAADLDCGARLPTRKEQALLFANVPELFKGEAYWSGEQPADVPDSAWCQDFSLGSQTWVHKSFKLRVVAVRRVPL